jgi:hypothetical protein
MIKYISYLVVFVFFSCTVQKDPDIINFENKLGPESVETLNKLVADFETNYLKIYYKDVTIDEAYLLFLKDIKNGDSVKQYNYKKMREMFKKSKLFSDIYLKVDSVWIAKDKNNDPPDFTDDSAIELNIPNPYPKLIIRFKHQNFENGFSYEDQSFSAGDRSYFEKYSEEELIQNGYLTRRYDNGGNYAMALLDIQDRGLCFKIYYEKRINSGGFFMENLASGLLYYNADTSDYFIKRIIVLDIFY